MYSFDSFIVGASNHIACSAAKTVAKNPLHKTINGKFYNPLIICGGTGMGKTHLLKAIKSEVNTCYPELKVVYVKTREYVNERIISIVNNTEKDFFDKYIKTSDIVLIDDFQPNSLGPNTLEDFLRSLIAILQGGIQVVLASNLSAKELLSITDRLNAYSDSGILAEIMAPEYETRCAIVKSKADIYHLKLDDKLIRFVARKRRFDAFQLEGITKKIHAICSFAHEEPSVSVTRCAIKDI